MIAGAMTSPPYADSVNSETNGIDWTKVKPDYPGRVMHDERIALAQKHHNDRNYGASEGQIGALHEGDFKEVIGNDHEPHSRHFIDNQKS